MVLQPAAGRPVERKAAHFAAHLRVVGLVVGAAGVAFCMLYFRGARWNRFNFLVALLGSVFIAVVSVEPRERWTRRVCLTL